MATPKIGHSITNHSCRAVLNLVPHGLLDVARADLADDQDSFDLSGVRYPIPPADLNTLPPFIGRQPVPVYDSGLRADPMTDMEPHGSQLMPYHMVQPYTAQQHSNQQAFNHNAHASNGSGLHSYMPVDPRYDMKPSQRPMDTSSTSHTKRKVGRHSASKNGRSKVPDNNRVSKNRQEKPPPAAIESSKERDEENLTIAKLRVHELMEWPQIVEHMNETRIRRGQKPTFTDAAVYGRFKRNGSALFVKAGLTAFNPASYMHLKHYKARLDPPQSSLHHSRISVAGTAPMSGTGPISGTGATSSDALFVPSRSPTRNTSIDNSVDADGEPDDEDAGTDLTGMLHQAIARCEHLSHRPNFWQLVVEDIKRQGGPMMSLHEAHHMWTQTSNSNDAR